MALRDQGKARAEVWPGSTVNLRRVPTVPVTPPVVRPGPGGTGFALSPNRQTGNAGNANTARRLQAQQQRLQRRG